ncbi:MAG: ABC transporter ATP-binding protein [Clostridia bacterium]|nr:ABC transporter ATP-binding protein [Clostridia bacterium]
MIKISHMSKIYSTKGGSVTALDNVSLNIGKGELVAIVGQSGSGKSTLMNILGCLSTPTAGRYTLSGQDVHNLSFDERSLLRRDKIGFIFQGFNLLPKMSAIENVALPLMCAKVSYDERVRRAKDALCRVGLERRLNHKPHEMSGGQQQRVAIARALISNPHLILADEPTGNLDSSSGDEVLRLLIEANKAGHTVILITHDEKIARRTDRKICISDGRIISDINQ